jgi:hypothetical protein
VSSVQVFIWSLSLSLFQFANFAEAQSTLVYSNITKDVNRDELVNQLEAVYKQKTNANDDFVIFISSRNGIQPYELLGINDSATIDSLRRKIKEQFEQKTRDFTSELIVVNDYLSDHKFFQSISSHHVETPIEKRVKLVFFLNADGMDSRFDLLREGFVQKLLLTNRLQFKNGLIGNLDLEIYKDGELQ